MAYIYENHFTLEEANTIIKEIQSDVIEMINLKKKLDELGYDVYQHSFFSGRGSNGENKHLPELTRLIEIIKSITRRGIEIKGIDMGLVDFPHIRNNGEEVYLCWKADEPSIEYWHPIPDGFRGRRHINEL